MTTKAAKKPVIQDWHSADVIAALHKKGLTLKGLATAYGLSTSTSLSATFNRSYPINEQRIADALGLHPMEIWPSRYFPDGTRKPQGFRALQKCTPTVNPSNSKRVANSGNLKLAN